jgi:hypothetical protein
MRVFICQLLNRRVQCSMPFLRSPSLRCSHIRQFTPRNSRVQIPHFCGFFSGLRGNHASPYSIYYLQSLQFYSGPRISTHNHSVYDYWCVPRSTSETWLTYTYRTRCIIVFSADCEKWRMRHPLRVRDPMIFRAPTHPHVTLHGFG